MHIFVLLSWTSLSLSEMCTIELSLSLLEDHKLALLLLNISGFVEILNILLIPTEQDSKAIKVIKVNKLECSESLSSTSR